MGGDRFDELEQRIARLESRIDGRAAPQRTTRGATPLTGVLYQWRREAEERSLPGKVGYVGAAYVDSREYSWQREHSLADLLPADWSPAAGILEALGSPQRLALLKALLAGRRTSSELLEALGGDQGGTTSGQLYHHLRALQSARLIMQWRRGEYDLAPGAAVFVLTILAAALSVATDPPPGPPAAVPQPG
jgi:DNA-binding transcriptional ArsR family regulator